MVFNLEVLMKGKILVPFFYWEDFFVVGSEKGDNLKIDEVTYGFFVENFGSESMVFFDELEKVYITREEWSEKYEGEDPLKNMILWVLKNR